MANLNTIFSFTIKDDSSKKRALQLFSVNADTATLANLKTILDTVAAEIDAVTDGQIVEESIRVIYPITAGVKSSPVSGSNDEETGLITFELDGLPQRSWGLDIPAFPDGKTVTTDHNLINLADTDVAALTGDLQAGGWKNEDWSYALDVVRSGIVTFRKLRRQLARRRR